MRTKQAKRKVTMMIGIPASGKSTYVESFAKLRWNNDYPIVFSPDYRLWRNDRGDGRKYVWSKEASAYAWATTYQSFGAWLLYGQGDCVWDATLVRPVLRSPIINIAKGVGCRVEAVFFKTPLRTCLARNRKRTPDRMVPEKTVREMHEALTPPSRSEGFDSVRIFG